MRQPDEADVIRPASPDTAKRVGKQALAGARETGRSKDIKKEDNLEIKQEVVVKTIVNPDGTETQITETVEFDEMAKAASNKNTPVYNTHFRSKKKFFCH